LRKAFGTSVSIQDTTAVVGAPNSYNNRGSISFFTRLGSTWGPQQVITPPTSASNVSCNGMGHHVALSSSADWAAIGCLGAGISSPGVLVYHFQSVKSTWVLDDVLVPPASFDINLDFGATVEISTFKTDMFIVVGAPTINSLGLSFNTSVGSPTLSGEVVVYSYDYLAQQWVVISLLTPDSISGVDP
jgi:hypothetical protein